MTLDKETIKLCFTIGTEEFFGSNLEGLEILKNGIPTNYDGNCSGKENSIACITAYRNNNKMVLWPFYDGQIGATYYRIEFEGDLNKIYLDDDGFYYYLSNIIYGDYTYENEIFSKLEKINEDFTKIKILDVIEQNIMTMDQFLLKNTDFPYVAGIVYNDNIKPNMITRIDLFINRDSEPYEDIIETLYEKGVNK